MFSYLNLSREVLVYFTINFALPKASRLLRDLDIDSRFYVGLSLFVIILCLNTYRALNIRRYKWIYKATIIANILAYVGLGMLSWITAIPVLKYIF